MSPVLEKNLVTLLRILILIFTVGSVYFFVKYFWPLFENLLSSGIKAVLPFLVSLLLASLLNPLVSFLEKKFRLSRTWATLIALVGFLFIMGVFLFLLVSNIIRELIQLSQALGTFSQLKAWNIDFFVERFQGILISLNLPKNLVQEALSNIWKLFDVIKNIIGTILTHLFLFVASFPKYLILLILTIIAGFFITRDYYLIKTGILKVVPEKWNLPLTRVGIGLSKALRGYLRAQLLLVSLTGLESLIGLTILGVSYAHLLALTVAFFDFLPILGPGTFYIPWSIWMFLSGNIRLGIGLLILYAIIVVVRQLLEPKVIGQSIGLHPLATLIALYFGFTLLGVWGLILGPAIAIAYKAFVDGQKEGG